MNLNFETEFLYYHELKILDASDPKMDELRPHIKKFAEFLKNAPLEEVIEFIVMSYSKKHCHYKYWFTELLDIHIYKIDDIVIYP